MRVDVLGGTEKTQKSLIIFGLVALLIIVAATAHGEVTFHQNQPLTYDNGTSMTLPAGTSSSLPDFMCWVESYVTS